MFESPSRSGCVFSVKATAEYCGCFASYKSRSKIRKIICITRRRKAKRDDYNGGEREKVGIRKIVLIPFITRIIEYILIYLCFFLYFINKYFLFNKTFTRSWDHLVVSRVNFFELRAFLLATYWLLFYIEYYLMSSWLV